MAYKIPDSPCSCCANAHETINYKRWCYVWNRPVRDGDSPCTEMKHRET